MTSETVTNNTGAGQAKINAPSINIPPKMAKAVPAVRVSADRAASQRRCTAMPVPITTAAATLKQGLSTVNVSRMAPPKCTIKLSATSSEKVAMPSTMNV